MLGEPHGQAENKTLPFPPSKEWLQGKYLQHHAKVVLTSMILYTVCMEPVAAVECVWERNWGPWMGETDFLAYIRLSGLL